MKLSKGKKLFTRDEGKYSYNFYLFLLEWIIGWGVIYYNTGFRTTLEALVEEGVTFPKEFGYIKSDSIKYGPIIKFLTD